MLAETILKQLGGNRFCMMVGANRLIAHKDGLSFRIGRNCKNVNYVKVTLMGDDTYGMKFSYVTKNGEKIKKEIESGIYCDQLEEIFRTYTGMETRMPRIIGINC